MVKIKGEKFTVTVTLCCPYKDQLLLALSVILPLVSIVMLFKSGYGVVKLLFNTLGAKVEFDIGDEVIVYVLLIQKLVPLVLLERSRLIVSLTFI